MTDPALVTAGLAAATIIIRLSGIIVGQRLPQQGAWARALNALQRPTEALQAAGRALRLEPRSALAHYSLGHALTSLGRAERAVAAYDRALQLDPDHRGQETEEPDDEKDEQHEAESPDDEPNRRPRRHVTDLVDRQTADLPGETL